MGMTIEKAHEILSNGLANAPSEHEWCMAFKLAINTMCKYQKIAEIYQWAKDRSYLVEADDIMTKLSEVLEDGSN